MDFEKLKNQISLDAEQHCERDITVLTNSVFAESYKTDFLKILGVEYNFTFWFAHGNKTNFYHSKDQQLNFEKTIGLRAIEKEIGYTKDIAQKLYELTDWFNDFIEKDYGLEEFLKNKDEFISNYRLFFVHHQIVYWTADYISKNLPTDRKGSEIVAIFDKAYKYNELVVPKIEEYFKKIKVDKFLYDELGGEYKYFDKQEREKGVGILVTDGKREILNPEISKRLAEFIEEKNEIDLTKINKVKGVPAQKGFYLGKVQLVEDFSDLNNVRKGVILVAHQIRPQFNREVIKAGAIVTDEGGILSHASMLAREFNITCVVGTKIATKVFKDGNLVEVNGETGLVKFK